MFKYAENYGIIVAMDIIQFVPEDVCLKCDVCCRFLDLTSPFVPYFFKGETDQTGGVFNTVGIKKDPKPLPIKTSSGEAHKCRFFDEPGNSCSIYRDRPLDCALYPFMVTYNKDNTGVVLVIDTKCPYAAKMMDSPAMNEYASLLAKTIESEPFSGLIVSETGFLNAFQEDSFVMSELPVVSGKIFPKNSGLRKISLEDRSVFQKFLPVEPALSAFSFESIYIWSNSLDIFWKIAADTLFVFAGTRGDLFLPVPPLSAGGWLDNTSFNKAFDILSTVNSPLSSAARAENVPENLARELLKNGFKTVETDREYIYKSADLAALKGDKYKHHRALVNHFVKNNSYAYRPLRPADITGCLDLYVRWSKNKMTGNIKRFMAEDSYLAHKTALLNMEKLGLSGRVVETDGGITAYTLAFPLGKDTIAVLVEISEPATKGLAQFISRELIREFGTFRGHFPEVSPEHTKHTRGFVNTLGDSGLDTLKATKEAYHPCAKVPVFTVYPDKTHELKDKG